MDDIIIAERPNRAPTHPGAILREDVLPHLNITVTAAALQLGVTRQQLHRVLAEESGISPEMALRLGKFCGNGPTIWIRMQETFDLWHAAKKIGSKLDKIPSHKITEPA
ncbi:HigA family addiction module antitoxin [Beijerinckia sp. L45]|uniref:HigA family addiction module antitoxin n=1 Tax=Beijerinckia sp. L45 TaxID=1641855 RepID=UPI00131BFB60|nr:HigA family addiction module antitoxin [Beijerinckia sp. L45]